MFNISLDLKFADPARNKPKRRILLVEPNYHNKYPPLGLMKLSAYHKQLGDTVVFWKGRINDYYFDEKYRTCMDKIKTQGFVPSSWSEIESCVFAYLKSRRIADRENVLRLIPKGYTRTVENILIYYAHKFSPQNQWDRVYVTTLFTFYWKQTIRAIEFAKQVANSVDSVYVGGVAASLIPDLFAEETGLNVEQNILTGLLDKPSILDDNQIIIDRIIPDYSILQTVDYHYPLDTGYLTFMTKGCTRTCGFCAVPKLEPVYEDKISIEEQIRQIAERHGERKDLILMDNNVLGSEKLPEIIQEILDMGFTKDATYTEPNQLKVLTNYLKAGDDSHSEEKYLKNLFEFLAVFGEQQIKSNEIRKEYYQLLKDSNLDSWDTFTKEAVLNSVAELNMFVEKYRNVSKRKRFVDFNQGLDCRYINEDNMKLLSKIPIKPMRISFDFYGLRKQYEKAVRLADQYGLRDLSNYMLYNYRDKPLEFWQRVRVNAALNRELKANIYCFPMKFIPISGKQSRDRSFIGKHWNRKFLRAIQVVLNVTRGSVPTTPSLIDKAFGATEDEFFKILMMPDEYIRYRFFFEEVGQTDKWYDQWQNLNNHERKIVDQLIQDCEYNSNGVTPKTVKTVLRHYQLRYDKRSHGTIEDFYKNFVNL